MKKLIVLLGILTVASASLWATETVTKSANDPYVMKIYPDGTKVIVRWSEIGKGVDHGEKFGGAPRIVAYDPSKDGVVPIGTPQGQDSKPVAASNAMPAAGSVVAPESTGKMDYTGNNNPDTYQDPYGPMEGFMLRSAVGVAYQQPLSGRTGGGTYSRTVFQPGIRFDLEPAYNVTDWFRVGLETGMIYNQLHSITTEGETAYAGSRLLGNGGLFQVPVMASVTFTFPSDGPIRGYFGGSTGASWNVLQASASDPDDLTPFTYTSWQWNYVWQVTAGFTYNVAPGLDLDLAYKMLSAPSPSFQGSGQYKSSYNHAAEIGLVWRF